MMDIIMTLKECIALVLLTGAITGFLYAWAKSRETHKPKVNTLKQEIQKSQDETKQLEEETQTLQDGIQKETERSEELVSEIHKLEKEIHETEKMRNALEAQTEEIRHNYASTHSMLSTQQERQQQLQNEIGDKSVTSQLEEEQKMHEQIASLENQISLEADKLDDTMQRSKRIEAQKEEHEAHRNRVAETLSELEAKLTQKSDLLENLETTLQEKIASLKEESAKWEKMIQTYKEKLIKLKENR